MFAIQKVDQSQAEDIEYLGTKRKFWFSRGNQRYLFKAEERGTGEDWAEKVVRTGEASWPSARGV